jgi:membrane associated rhomboid family serine protease
MSSEAQVHIQIPTPGKLFTPAVTVIIVLSLLGFLASLFARDFTLNWLALSSGQLMRGMVWQLVTYPFVFLGPVALLFDLSVILVIGSTIERQWGTKTFILFWLFVSVLCGLIWVFVGGFLRQPFPGLSSAACCYAMVAVFGLVFRGRRFLLMMTTVDAQTLALLMLGVSLILNLYPPINLIWMLGAALGYAFVKLREKSQYAQARPSDGDSPYQPGSFVDID